MDTDGFCTYCIHPSVCWATRVRLYFEKVAATIGNEKGIQQVTDRWPRWSLEPFLNLADCYLAKDCDVVLRVEDDGNLS